jgi:trehalose utilization protein
MNVLVWGENRHEQVEPHVREIYPDGMHETIAAGIRENLAGVSVGTTTLDEPEHGLTEEVLAQTDVLVWWGHLLHRKVSDAAVERIVARVREGGMGFVALHSAHMSKPYTALIEDDGRLGGVALDGGKETITVKDSDHPVAKGVGDFVIPKEESYDEEFGLGKPDSVVFHSAFDNGQQFRSGVAYTIGAGRVFYFRPGHEEYDTLFQPEVKKVIHNAVLWTAGRS